MSSHKTARIVHGDSHHQQALCCRASKELKSISATVHPNVIVSLLGVPLGETVGELFGRLLEERLVDWLGRGRSVGEVVEGALLGV
jgi:hypothetical protein